jgi:hypothetical protein
MAPPYGLFLDAPMEPEWRKAGLDAHRAEISLCFYATKSK